MIKIEITIRNPKKLTEGYVISKGMDKDRVWIERLDGEGGDFRPQSFYDCIDKFYKENF